LDGSNSLYLDGSNGWYSAKAWMVCVGPLAVWLEAVVDLVRLGRRIGTQLLELQNIHVYNLKNSKWKVVRDLLPLYVHCEEANQLC
jgi:hypothetical protein